MRPCGSSMSISMSRNQFASAAVLGAIARGVSIAIRLAAVPMTVALLSAERYGLWLIINSLIGWFGFTDFGIPSALQNRLIFILSTEGRTRAGNLVAFAMRLMVFIALSVFFIGLVAGVLVPWGNIFKVTPEFQSEFRATLILCFIGLTISFPSRIGAAIYNAHGRLAIQPLTDLIVQVVSFGTLASAVILHWHSLFALVTCSLAGIVSGPFLLTLAAMRRYGYGLTGGAVEPNDRKSLLGKGAFFFLAVIGELLILQSDAFIIGATMGAAAVPLFLIPNTLWMNFLQAQNIFLRPLWTILSQAYFSGNKLRLRSIMFKSIFLSTGGALLFGGGLVVFGGYFIHWWSKGVASLSPVMAWGFFSYALVASVDNVLATCMNAFNLIEIRFGYTLLFGVTKVAVTIVVLKTVGIDWLPFAYAVVMLITSMPFAVWAVTRTLTRISNSADPLAGGSELIG